MMCNQLRTHRFSNLMSKDRTLLYLSLQNILMDKLAHIVINISNNQLYMISTKKQQNKISMDLCMEYMYSMKIPQIIHTFQQDKYYNKYYYNIQLLILCKYCNSNRFNMQRIGQGRPYILYLIYKYLQDKLQRMYLMLNMQLQCMMYNLSIAQHRFDKG